MRTSVNIVRVIVALLFIISGLVKANDPLGLTYKMEEFFEVWNISLASSSFFAKDLLISFFTFLHGKALWLSILMITLEIVAGVALLTGWKKNFILYLLLVLIVFFTFLTAYAFLAKNPDGTPRFRSCGCFGDCIPIAPLTSFIKDIVLLAMISFLIIFRSYINPWLTTNKQLATIGAAFLVTIFFQWYVLNYLPVADCLPYKKGNNIAEQMKLPPNAVPDSFAMKFIYEKGGQRYEFDIDQLPADLDQYTFIDRTQKLVRKGNAVPAITGFSLTDPDGNDLVPQILEEPKAIIFFVLDFEDANDWIGDLKKIYTTAKTGNIPFFVATPDASKGKIILSSGGLSEILILNADNTAVKTAARTNPTVYYLEKGNVVEKLSIRKTDHLLNNLK